MSHYNCQKDDNNSKFNTKALQFISTKYLNEGEEKASPPSWSTASHTRFTKRKRCSSPPTITDPQKCNEKEKKQLGYYHIRNLQVSYQDVLCSCFHLLISINPTPTSPILAHSHSPHCQRVAIFPHLPGLLHLQSFATGQQEHNIDRDTDCPFSKRAQDTKMHHSNLHLCLAFLNHSPPVSRSSQSYISRYRPHPLLLLDQTLPPKTQILASYMTTTTRCPYLLPGKTLSE